MKKVLAFVMVLVLAGSIFTGCAQKKAATTEQTEATTAATAAAENVQAEDKEVVIAYICKALDQVWFINESGGIKDKATELGASNVLLIDSKMNPDTYLSSLDNVIAQNVDGIIVCPPDQQLSQATIDKCKEAGIPIMAIDDPLQDGSGNLLAPMVGLDAYKIGEACGTWLAGYVNDNKLIEDPSKVGLLLLTMDTVSSCVPRTEGEFDTFTKLVPGFPQEQIFRSDYNGETEKGFDAAAATITANPQIETWLVMTPNDEGAIGASRALEQAGLAEKAIVVGLGGYLCDGEFEKESSPFKASAYMDSYLEGTMIAEIMMNYILNGTEIPQETKVGAEMVTKENYKEVKGIQ